LFNNPYPCGEAGKSRKNINVMTEELIDYANLIDGALRGVLRSALERATDCGLPGQHKFYITFETKRPGVSISPALAAQYPEEMTIVLEHQFWDLDINEEAFSVVLSFSGKREQLYIPFNAVSAFVDPSANFGLQFSSTEGARIAGSSSGTDKPQEVIESEENEISDTNGRTQEGTIVALDSYRKK
tara:strand:+ start:275 stop:832 length:558 start_codon:yes stop_codon:yes gene_type:complete